jgi:cytochrome c553
MKAGVMPKMHALFASMDASKYGEMTCKTCHGVGAIEGSFRMPNPDLPKLDPKPEAFKTLEQTNPRMFNFMATQVEPTMASLLAVQPHDMKTNTGFSCFNCHTKT